MDFRKASAQMVRALRGTRSQRAFSRRLGYRSNVASDWEAGRRQPTAQEVLRACHKLGVNVVAAFEHFQPACAAVLGAKPPFAVAAWLGDIAGGTSIAALAGRSGVSRFAIARWLQGKTRPRLHHFLQLVEAITGRASDLVQGLVPIDQVAELNEVARQRAAAKRLAFDEPWSAAVMRVLETVGYRNAPDQDRGYVARRLGLPLEQASLLLGQLHAAGLVRLDGGRYEVGAPLTVDAQASAADLIKLKSHWAQVSLMRSQEPRPEDWLGFNLVSISADDLEQVREVLRRAFREIRTIAAASSPPESVVLLNLHLVTWNEGSPQRPD